MYTHTYTQTFNIASFFIDFIFTVCYDVLIRNLGGATLSGLNALDINRERDRVVSKSVDLVRKARHELSAKETTLVDFMISRVKDNDNQLLSVETTLSEINAICDFGEGGASYGSTEKALYNLTSKGMLVETEDGWITNGRWLEKVYIKEGQAVLKLDKDLAPYLLHYAGKKHSHYSFRDQVNLKSIYAKKLYELLQSYDDGEEVERTVEFMKEFFNKENTEWYRLLNYIRKAVNTITEVTTMTVTYSTIKQGKSTVAIRFLVQKKKEELIN